MTAPLRLGVFAAVLALVLGASFVAARALDVDLADGAPVTRAAADDAGHSEAPVVETDQAAGAHGAGSAAASPVAAGLSGVDGTYSLVRQWPVADAGEESVLTFQILDGSGSPVTAYDIEHAKWMHLIVVRRDLANFQHLHPELGSTGTWTQRLTLPAAGSYRMFADFTVDGEKHTLGADLQAPGSFTPVPLPAAASRTSVGGYTVTLTGDPRPGEASELEFAVTRGDAAVEDLEPYLGARGHLVALREGDLGYLHVHPTGDDAGNRVRFATTVPSAGTYRLYLQFQRAGVVHTAEHTLVVPR